MAQHATSLDDEAVREGVFEFKARLGEALSIADTLSLPPELGARIQEILDLVDEYFQP